MLKKFWITLQMNNQMIWEKDEIMKCYDWFESWLLRAKGQHSVARIMMMIFLNDFEMNLLRYLSEWCVSSTGFSDIGPRCQCKTPCFDSWTISAANCIHESCSELFSTKRVHYLKNNYLKNNHSLTAFARGER